MGNDQIVQVVMGVGLAAVGLAALVLTIYRWGKDDGEVKGLQKLNETWREHMDSQQQAWLDRHLKDLDEAASLEKKLGFLQEHIGAMKHAHESDLRRETDRAFERGYAHGRADAFEEVRAGFDATMDALEDDGDDDEDLEEADREIIGALEECRDVRRATESCEAEGEGDGKRLQVMRHFGLIGPAQGLLDAAVRDGLRRAGAHLRDRGLMILSDPPRVDALGGYLVPEALARPILEHATKIRGVKPAVRK